MSDDAEATGRAIAALTANPPEMLRRVLTPVARQLVEALAENERLRTENAHLKLRLSTAEQKQASVAE